MLEQLYRQTVLDHYKNPRNYGKLGHPSVVQTPYKNPTCGDVMVLYTRIENGLIEDIKYQGEGCSISMASCSMMTVIMKKQTLAHAEHVIGEFTAMIRLGSIANPDSGTSDQKPTSTWPCGLIF